jgi:hypothetical protein
MLSWRRGEIPCESMRRGVSLHSFSYETLMTTNCNAIATIEAMDSSVLTTMTKIYSCTSPHSARLDCSQNAASVTSLTLANGMDGRSPRAFDRLKPSKFAPRKSRQPLLSRTGFGPKFAHPQMKIWG